MRRQPPLIVVPALLAVYMPFCAATIRPATPSDAPKASLWEEPTDVAGRDLLNGPWGLERAPDPEAVYTLVQRKHTGVNPGMTVRDPLGREWSVKQGPPDGRPSEAQVEVVVSRVLSAVGYHQPPVYYLPAFTLEDDWGTHRERAGRFRLKDKTLKDRGSWSWHENPFVGSVPYQGLLGVLMILNSSDLKNANNTLYEHRAAGGREQWYVVRDVGTALGSTGRLAPSKGDPGALARRRLIKRVGGEFVEFNYRGWHQELVRDRVTVADLGWAGELLARLTERQWHEAFRAGGYRPETASQFIDTLCSRIAEALDASRDARRGAVEGP
jgi:hypothetical protein